MEDNVYKIDKNFELSQMNQKTKPNYLLINITFLLVIVSILQQFSFFNSYYSVIRNVIYLIGFLAVILAIRHFFKIKIDNFTRYFLFLFLSFQVLSLIGILFGNSINNIGTLYLPISISFFIYMIALVIYKNSNVKVYNLLIIIYATLVLLLTINIFNSYFGEIFISSQYVYRQKNSKGPMIVFSILFSIFLILNLKSKILKIFFSFSIVFEFLALNLIRNRSGLVALYLVIFILILKSLKIKRISSILTLTIVILLILLFAILASDLVTSIISSAIEVFVKNYNINDLNNLSAGRLEKYAQALSVFEKNPIIGTLGVQNYYVDNAFLLVLANYGLIGAIFYIPFILFVLYTIIINVRRNSIKDLRFYVSLAWFATLTISLFEGIPPFGPGTTYIIVWILLPLITTKNREKRMRI